MVASQPAATISHAWLLWLLIRQTVYRKEEER